MSSRGDDLHYAEQQLTTELLGYVEKNDVTGLSQLISVQPKASAILTQHRFKFGSMAIHFASASNYVDMIKFLLRFGVDVNVKNDYGWTPLILAAYHNHKDALRLLISVNTIDINACTDFGYTALLCAIKGGQIPMIRLLLDHGAGVNRKEHQGVTPLMLACFLNKPTIVSILLQKGAECNTQSRLNGWTALMYAANSSPSFTMVKMLVENGADPDMKAWTGQNAVQIAMSKNHMEVAEYLIAVTHNDDVTTLTLTKQSNLERHQIFDILANEDFDSLKILLADDPSAANSKDSTDGFTPLILAAMKGDVKSCKLLLEQGAIVNERDSLGWPALKYAAYYNKLEVVKLLISKGAHISISKSLPKDPDKVREEVQVLSTDSDIVDLLLKCVRFDPYDHSDSISFEGEKSQTWFSRMLGRKHKRGDSSTQLSNNGSFHQRLAIPKLSKKKTKSVAPDAIDVDEITQDNSMVRRSRMSSMANKLSSSQNLSEGVPTPSPPSTKNSLDVSDGMQRLNLDASSSTISKQFATEEKRMVINRTPQDRSLNSSRSTANILEELPRPNKFEPEILSSSSLHQFQPANRTVTNEFYHAQTPAAEANELGQFLTVLNMYKYIQNFKRRKIVSLKEAASLSDKELRDNIQITDDANRRLILLNFASWKREQQKKKVRNFQDSIKNLETGHSGQTVIPVVRISSPSSGTSAGDSSSKKQTSLHVEPQNRPMDHINVDKHLMIAEMKRIRREKKMSR